MDFILFGAIRDNEEDGGLGLGEYSSGIETRKSRRIVRTWSCDWCICLRSQ